MSRIETIQDWIAWAAAENNLKKTAALDLAKNILGVARSTVWLWEKGEAAINPPAARLLHIYAHPGDFYWLAR